MKSRIKSLFSLIIVSAMTVSSAVLADSAKCSPCQAAKSMRDAAAQSIQDAKMAAPVISKAGELDEIADAARAPREELADPCNPCGPDTSANFNNAWFVNEQLSALRCCCAAVAQRLAEQGKDARKCCKRLNREINEVEELVESVIDQNATCCSVTEGLLISVIDTITSGAGCSTTDTLLTSVVDNVGDPVASSVLDIPTCAEIDIVTVVNGTDADVLTWLKSLYVLLWNLYECTCC